MSFNKYVIKQYSYDRIKELNEKLGSDIYSIKKSKTKLKKIDIFRKDEKIASIGAIKKNGVPYLDYPSYIETMGQKYADRRRKLYYERHTQPDIIDGEISKEFWSKFILW